MSPTAATVRVGVRESVESADEVGVVSLGAPDVPVVAVVMYAAVAGRLDVTATVRAGLDEPASGGVFGREADRIAHALPPTTMARPSVHEAMARLRRRRRTAAVRMLRRLRVSSGIWGIG
jgi:hypothetical protein